MSPALRIALFTLDSALSRAAVAAFLAGTRHQVVLLGLSVPERPAAGSALHQAWRHLQRSGPRLLPYLVVNYTLPRLRPPRWPPGLPIHPVRALNGPQTAAMLRAAAPDLLISLHFDQIFTAETLALAPLGGINLHPGLLPRHRGPVPTIYALAEDPPGFGVTIHRLVPKIDAGAILAQAGLPQPAGTTASAAARALHLAGVPLLAQALDRIAGGMADPPAPSPLPYCPFPPPGLLRGLARRGRRLVGWADFRQAFRR